MNESQGRPTVIKMLATLLPTTERWRLLIALASSVLSACVEVVGVASISPLMAIIVNPHAFDGHQRIQTVWRMFGVDGNPRAQVLLVGGGAAISIVMSNVLAGLNAWVQQKMGARTKRRVGTMLFDSYLSQPFGYHLRRDSAELMSAVVHDADAVSRLLLALFQVISRSVLVVLLVAIIVWQNPLVALATTAVMGGAYFIIFSLVRSRQENLGAAISRLSAERTRVLNETFGGIKEILVLGRERASSERFLDKTGRVAAIQAQTAVIGGLPKYILEPVAFGGIIAIALAGSDTSGAGSAITTLALFAFAGYRLLPALQQIFAAAVEMKFSKAGVEQLYRDWVETSSVADLRWQESESITTDGLERPDILINNVNFFYPGRTTAALESINLSIPFGQCLGFVGRTGSGKSTLVDLLLGLHEPASGSVRFGGLTVSRDNLRAIRSRIGYVPQQVFLSNSSVAQNIAFGLPMDEIDMDRVRLAGEQSQSLGFIEQLDAGFETELGERGVRLSGGQRQRLGIARALYLQPDVLIFDEATSALDGLTESAVMDAIHSLAGSRTVLLIAHRLDTIKACDRIIQLASGKIVADGRYSELMEASEHFRTLAMAGRSSDEL